MASFQSNRTPAYKIRVIGQLKVLVAFCLAAAATHYFLMMQNRSESRPRWHYHLPSKDQSVGVVHKARM
jgi:hypothetical protein